MVTKQIAEEIYKLYSEEIFDQLSVFLSSEISDQANSDE